MNQNTDIVLSQDGDYALFVGKKFNYYLNKWQKIIKEKCNGDITKLEKYNISHISFNISAFIFSHTWFLYRKMYLQAIFIIIISCFGGIFKLSNGWILGIFINIFTGLYGNKIYFIHVTQKIKKIRLKNKDDDIKNIISSSGGCSKVAVFIAFLIIGIFIYISFRR